MKCANLYRFAFSILLSCVTIGVFASQSTGAGGMPGDTASSNWNWRLEKVDTTKGATYIRSRTPGHHRYGAHWQRWVFIGKRIDKYGKWALAAGENIDYGNAQARSIVTSFLIDDGVPSRGHRENLPDPAFNFVGVAVGLQPAYRAMCVLDFAGAYK
ncbi:MAG TPA: CAP domain-containing protein [Desulfomonilia bacterium]|nr:CAP domain-containing protein [Desulfomonilia bacterium]